MNDNQSYFLMNEEQFELMTAMFVFLYDHLAGLERDKAYLLLEREQRELTIKLLYKLLDEKNKPAEGLSI